jgi:NADPH:quinone reductase
MARIARINRTGGPEVIEWVNEDIGEPGPGELRYRTTAAGLNYVDTYYRRGIYPVELPSGLGVEAVGVVEAVGEGVDGFAPGDRVATFGPKLGAYASHRTMPASLMFKLPDDMDDETVAAGFLKGCTTEFLVERCVSLKPGDAVLVHAAAGGVGLILCQWLKAVGAYVIGTVSNDEKAALAKAAGADETINYKSEDIAQRTRELTGGKGVRVTYDGIGMDTWNASLDATGKRGIIVSYGNVSAPVTGVAMGILATKGSLYNTRPTLYNYYEAPEERSAGAERLWTMIREGKVKIDVGQRYALEDVAQAHIDLESGRTKGSTILVP